MTAPAIALIVTVCADALLVVVTENVAVVAPWATVMLAGTDATALSLERLTAKPPTRAGFVRVTVPVEGDPPGVVVGFKESVDKTGSGGVTVRVAVRTIEAAVAVIVIDWVEATPVVVTANVATVEPCATVTLAGTVAAALSLERLTTKPPANAGFTRATVPVDVAPPATDVGLRERVESADGGLTARRKVRTTLPADAVIVAVWGEATVVVVAVKVAEVEPCATVTLAGTEAAALLLERFTTKPPESAAIVNVIVPVDGDPAITEGGLSEIEDSATPGGFNVRGAVRTVEASVAVIVAVVSAPTDVVVTVNVLETAPATCSPKSDPRRV